MANDDESGDGTVTTRTRRILLHVDAEDGRLLDATDEMTGDFVPYGVRKVEKRDRKTFSDSKKMIFDPEKNRDKYALLAVFFGKFLCLADEIRVYAVGSAGRFPTACSYRFPPTSGKTILPMQFDYATCRLAVPVPIDVTDVRELERAAGVVSRVARESRGGHGHPGLTKEEAELAVLRAKAWDEVDEDVIATPYRDGYANDWFPVLREDGRVGLFVATVDGVKSSAYVVVENALPHFACDQMRVLFSENPNKLTWKQWTRSPILERAIELSGAVADAIASRVVERLIDERLIALRKNLVVEKTRVFVNRLVCVNSDIRYDAGVLRGNSFCSVLNKPQKALFRVGDDGYALVTKLGYEPHEGDVFPANARNADELNALFKGRNRYDPPVFLREVSAPVDESVL